MNKDNGCEESPETTEGSFTPRKRMRGAKRPKLKEVKRTRARQRRGRKRSGKEMRERKDTGREKVRWRDEKCSGRGGYLCWRVVSPAGFLPKRRFDPDRERKGLCFHRRLIEQRAPNCSIRLSRKSGPKNEFSNSTKLFMTHLSKSTKKREKKRPQCIPRLINKPSVLN